MAQSVREPVSAQPLPGSEAAGTITIDVAAKLLMVTHRSRRIGTPSRKGRPPTRADRCHNLVGNSAAAAFPPRRLVAGASAYICDGPSRNVAILEAHGGCEPVRASCGTGST